jgi:hypothetical protein
VPERRCSEAGTLLVQDKPEELWSDPRCAAYLDSMAAH